MNKRIWQTLIGLAILSTVAFGYTNCGMKTFFNEANIYGAPAMSTTSGNPLTPPATYHASTPSILQSVCALLQSCYGAQGANQNECVNVLTNESSSDDSVLGLTETTYTSYHDAIVGEQVGAITANQSGVSTCIADIAKQNCSSIKGSYDPGLSNPYTPVANSFPMSCTRVFGSPGGSDDHQGGYGKDK